MNYRPYFFILIFGFWVGVVFRAAAQEGYDWEESTVRSCHLQVEEDLVDEGDTHAKSDLQQNPQYIPEGSESQEEEKDVLSFNFIYYIIQRYKKSDIVDQ